MYTVPGHTSKIKKNTLIFGNVKGEKRLLLHQKMILKEKCNTVSVPARRGHTRADYHRESPYPHLRLPTFNLEVWATRSSVSETLWPSELSATTSKQDWTNKCILSALFPAAIAQQRPLLKRGEGQCRCSGPLRGQMSAVQGAPLFPSTTRVQSKAALLRTRGKAAMAAQEHGTSVICPSPHYWQFPDYPCPLESQLRRVNTLFWGYFPRAERSRTASTPQQKCLWHFLVQRGWHLLPSTWDLVWTSGNGWYPMLKVSNRV